MKNILNKIAFRNYYYFRVIIPVFLYTLIFPLILGLFYIFSFFGMYLSIEGNKITINNNFVLEEIGTFPNRLIFYIGLYFYLIIFFLLN